MYRNLIEHWLTNVNEKGYQTPLCHVLIAEGYTILHLSSHGPGEEGKDIIARDSTGALWAFQLKGGDIDLGIWRAIRGEVEELAVLPIVYPGIAEGAAHKPVLVTNGVVRGDARTQIGKFSANWEQKNGAKPLDVWNGKQLLSLFLKHHAEFLPRELEEFREFVELYVSEFRDRLPRKKFASFIERLVSDGAIAGPATKAQRALASMVLLASYIISQYEAAQNHIAAAEGWTIVGVNILSVATRLNLAHERWERELGLVWVALERNMRELGKEVAERDNFVQPYLAIVEPLLYGVRVTITLGWVAVLGLFTRLLEWKGIELKKLVTVMRREFRHIKVVGEADWPYFFAVSLFVEYLGTSSEAEMLLGSWLSSIQSQNSGKQPRGVPNPYWLQEKVLAWLHGRLPKHEEETFGGSSFTALSVLDMLVRRWARQRVSVAWPGVSRLKLLQFVPDEPADLFKWNVDKGDLQTIDHPQPVSWSAWRSSVAATSKNGIAPLLLEHPEWLLPFVLTYPHRLNRQLCGVIECLVGRRGTLV